MTAASIISDWKKKVFKPVYWLEGEEEYFINQVTEYAENRILSDSETSFNLTVFYGKDADWAAVVNACRRYPMFAERQVVILKEAQQMRDVEKLEGYIESPLSSTLLVVAYKDKKLDARKKFAKLVKEKGELFTTKKIYDRELPEWTREITEAKGLSITPRALALLVDHVGNDLTRINNEVDKLAINLGKRKSINEDDIEQYIGVSKEYNVFELQSALTARDLARCIRIVAYFESNPKAAPIQMVLPSLYNFFSKVFMIHGTRGSEKEIAAAIGVNPFFIKEYMQASRLYNYQEAEKALLLLHSYNLKSVGVGSVNTEDASLLKELLVKIIS